MRQKPGPLTVDITNTAVIVVDMQNDFGAKAGMFGPQRGLIFLIIQKSRCPTARVFSDRPELAFKIIYTQNGLSWRSFGPRKWKIPNRDRQFANFHVRWYHYSTNGSKSRILMAAINWGTDIIPELKPEEGDYFSFPRSEDLHDNPILEINYFKCQLSRASLKLLP